MLLGETGTGKEIFAQSVHNGGSRKHRPFVAVNCAAISRELLESELFGHKAGAFTGAIKDKKGFLEEADTGTLFLDEIAELDISLQSKLLRVIETGEYFKVGESKNAKADIRIIAATNRDLKKEISAGSFREDLFYRLAVFQIALPPLRERTEDIPALAEYFAKEFSARMNKKEIRIDPEYIRALLMHNWPGNIRELKNCIERSLILSDSVLLPDSLPSFNSLKDGKTVPSFDLSSAEKIHIRKVLEYTKGNKTEAARLLNIALTTLYRKIEEYNLS